MIVSVFFRKMNDGSQMRGGGTPSRSRSGMNILAQQVSFSRPLSSFGVV